MGYTTGFTGKFKFDKPLAREHVEYLIKFSETRRMKRNPNKARALEDKTREAVRLPLGEDAEFFVGGGGCFGQDHDASIIEYNKPPETQPGLWCQWVPSDDGEYLEWNGAEKFYDYVEWLKYIVDNFLKPWGYSITGTVTWRGEDRGDVGNIIVKDNIVEAVHI